MKLEEHPTVRKHRAGSAAGDANTVLDADWLKTLARELGADDVGLVSIERPELDDQRADIQNTLPRARALLSFVVRLNQAPIKSPARSISNLEFHDVGDDVNEVARKIVQALERRGIEALNPSMGFPMEMQRFPGKLWVVSHKPVAAAAGLGHIGIHRNLIHPSFGSFILLGTVILGAPVSADDHAIDYNPCLECKLCVAACPVGAIAADGHFDFSACYTHNYREFMGGFTDWVETVAGAKNARAYRGEVTDGESASMWQSLSYGANYKSAYCIAVCPAGAEVIAPFLDDRKQHLEDTVKPLQRKEESVYVVRGSDAEEHVRRHYPHKHLRHVGNSLRPGSIAMFLDGLELLFQRRRAAEVDATYHFTFSGDEERSATVVIRRGEFEVEDGHRGEPNLRVTADSRTWIDFLAKNRGLAAALLTGKIKLKGSPRHLLRFAACFLA